MDREAIEGAAALLNRMRRSGERLDRLPEALRPRSSDEAYSIQLAALAQLGENIAGWKVATSAEFGVLIGALLRSRVFEDEAVLPSAEMPMRGIEVEIAFRFDRALPPRERAYEREEIEAAVTAFPALEIVDTRFRNYEATPVIERAADFMSNGAFVAGGAREDWRFFDLAALEVSLVIDGVEIVRRVGGHPSVDPLIPAIALANYLRSTSGMAAGMVATTGSCTGLAFAKADSVVRGHLRDLARSPASSGPPDA
jgi:2-keto-4-pentenoate hydratase